MIVAQASAGAADTRGPDVPPAGGVLPNPAVPALTTPATDEGSRTRSEPAVMPESTEAATEIA